MSFLADPLGNISGGIHDVAKSISSNPLVDAALAAASMAYGIPPEFVISGLGEAGTIAAGIGGISALTTGNLAKGLQAGLSAYGGASLADSAGFANQVTGGTPTSGVPVETHIPTPIDQIPGSPSYANSPITPGGGYNSYYTGEEPISNPATAGQ